MVANARTSSDAVESSGSARPAYELDFFALLRQLEAAHADRPRLGEGARPVDEPVRLAQKPSLAFAPAPLASFEPGKDGRPPRISQYFFGLFGPNGPLPLHLTEFAQQRELHGGDPTFRRFVDIFHHRLLLLFYRAWANSRPETDFDRPQSRRFDTYVGSVFGLGLPELKDRDALPDFAKLHLAGLMSMRTRPAVALAAMLNSFMRLPFRIEEFVGSWIPLPREDWLMLGARQRGAVLGADAVLGGSVWACQHKFRLICGPIGIADFRRLLPGSDSLARVRDLVRNFVGDEFEWDLNLVLLADEVPSTKLGVAGELGWTTWLGRRRSVEDADDVTIHPSVVVAR